MTRYEKFIESINTPEKLIQKSHNERSLFEDVLEGFCKGNCNDGDEYIVEHCDKCHLEYLNEEMS